MVFVVSFEHFMTFRRTVSRGGAPARAQLAAPSDPGPPLPSREAGCGAPAVPARIWPIAQYHRATAHRGAGCSRDNYSSVKCTGLIWSCFCFTYAANSRKICRKCAGKICRLKNNYQWKSPELHSILPIDYTDQLWKFISNELREQNLSPFYSIIANCVQNYIFSK